MAVLKSSDSEEQELFLREARISAFLQHPNIVPVYDMGINDEGQAFFTMKYIQGKTLSEILDAELVGTRAALTQAGRPISRWIMNTVNPENVGAFLFAWEFITAMVGELYDINAFDQPGVELGKRIAHGILGRPGFEKDAEIAAGLSENLKRVL